MDELNRYVRMVKLEGELRSTRQTLAQIYDIASTPREDRRYVRTLRIIQRVAGEALKPAASSGGPIIQGSRASSS